MHTLVSTRSIYIRIVNLAYRGDLNLVLNLVHVLNLSTFFKKFRFKFKSLVDVYKFCAVHVRVSIAPVSKKNYLSIGPETTKFTAVVLYSIVGTVVGANGVSAQMIQNAHYGKFWNI
jgi:hypothetical protein